MQVHLFSNIVAIKRILSLVRKQARKNRNEETDSNSNSNRYSSNIVLILLQQRGQV